MNAKIRPEPLPSLGRTGPPLGRESVALLTPLFVLTPQPDQPIALGRSIDIDRLADQPRLPSVGSTVWSVRTLARGHTDRGQCQPTRRVRLTSFAIGESLQRKCRRPTKPGGLRSCRRRRGPSGRSASTSGPAAGSDDLHAGCQRWLRRHFPDTATQPRQQLRFLRMQRREANATINPLCPRPTVCLRALGRPPFQDVLSKLGSRRRFRLRQISREVTPARLTQKSIAKR